MASTAIPGLDDASDGGGDGDEVGPALGGLGGVVEGVVEAADDGASPPHPTAPRRIAVIATIRAVRNLTRGRAA